MTACHMCIISRIILEAKFQHKKHETERNAIDGLPTLHVTVECHSILQAHNLG
jgi:hypothetical protein